mgnify:CR=1 FL=1
MRAKSKDVAKKASASGKNDQESQSQNAKNTEGEQTNQTTNDTQKTESTEKNENAQNENSTSLCRFIYSKGEGIDTASDPGYVYYQLVSCQHQLSYLTYQLERLFLHFQKQ